MKPPTSAAHELARDMRALAALLAQHPDQAVAGAAAPALRMAADVIEALANEMIWAAENGNELGELLCRMHAWAKCDLDVFGPGLGGGYARRHEESARALDLGLKALVQLERLTHAVGRS